MFGEIGALISLQYQGTIKPELIQATTNPGWLFVNQGTAYGLERSKNAKISASKLR